MPDSDWIQCPACGGSGTEKDPKGNTVTCSVCRGSKVIHK